MFWWLLLLYFLGLGGALGEVYGWVDLYDDFTCFSLPNTDHLADSVWSVTVLSVF